ncbi:MULTISPECIES: RDD family protein [Vitreoscilla]|uniref:RDD family protein n=1 Tax=Vitreoscilla stercoraria TaxID=61 RepID=A0ABY4EBD7_VITST|nr:MULTISPECIES: RDD family protein [Vitreoscilla]AUZ06080.2 putative RDD family protein [Vitreoscilla sp. C1]UOO92554.1 RDD family protein [Vitreoscilla stercoraria]
MSTSKLDTLIQVETPEAIDIQLRPASLYQRITAFSLDLLIRTVWFVLSTIALIMLADSLSIIADDNNFWSVIVGLMLINLFVTTWLYFVLFEVFNKGRTPGKMVAHIRVLHDDGSPIGWSASMIRNLLRAFDSLPFGYAIGIVSILLTDKGQRFGDLFSSSIVVDEQVERRQKDWLTGLKNIEVITPPVALTREEQYSIVSFTERHLHISRARQQELAEQLCYDLGLVSEQPIQTVLGMGKYYLGQKKEDL